MISYLAAIALQTATPDPDVGPGEIVDLWPYLVEIGWFLVSFVVVFLVGWYVVEPVITRGIRRRNRNNPTIQEAISRYVRLLVILVAIGVGAGVAGYGQWLGNSALVVAAGTLAIGVAAQTVIGSIVSGLVLVGDPEFNIGDYIEWSGGEGEIRSITLRVTRVTAPDGTLLTVPNTTLTSETVARPYGRGRYRVVDHIGLAYDDDIDAALDHLRAAAGELRGVLADPAPSAYVDEFGSDAVVVHVHYWIDDPRHRDIFRIRSAYARRVKDRLDRSDITISPTSKRELQGRIEVAETEPASS